MSQRFLKYLKNTSTSIFTAILSFVGNFVESISKLPWQVRTLVLASIVLGSLIRYLGLFGFGFYFDTISTQYDWGKNALELGYFRFWTDYPKDKLFDYPPISLFYEMVLMVFTIPFDKSPQAWVVFHKIIQWFFELGFISIVGFLLSKNKNISATIKALVLATLYLVPSLWFVSAIWGQNDLMVFVLGFLGFCLLFADKLKIFNNQIWYRSSYFYSGLVWAIAIWTKQQPLLFIPVIGLFFLQQLSWKDIYKVLLVFLPFLSFLLIFRGLYNETQQFYDLGIFGKTDNWVLMLYIAIASIIAIFAILFWFRNIAGNLRNLVQWLMGVFLLTDIISIPLAAVNHIRFAGVVFSSFARDNNVSNGASTFWGGFGNFLKGGRLVFSLENIGISQTIEIFGKTIKLAEVGISINQAGNIIFLVLLLVALWVILGLNFEKIKTLRIDKIFSKKLTFYDFVWLLWLVCSAYFFFFTKMHSRYLHYGILLGWLALTGIKNLKSFKIAFVLFFFTNIIYFLNQAMVFGVNNDYSQWVKSMISNFDENHLKLNTWMLLPFMGTTFFGFTLVWLLVDYRAKFAKKVVITYED